MDNRWSTVLGTRIVDDSSPVWIALTFGSSEVASIRARRIVACVNACRGIDVERLERFENLAEMLEFGVIAEQQRDALLEIVKYAVDNSEFNSQKFDEMCRDAILKISHGEG